MAVQRHKDEHLPRALVTAQAEEDVRQALDVVGQLKAVNGVALAILKEARQMRDGELALKAIDRIHKQLEFQSRLLGDLDERPVVNLVVSPEWLGLRGAILRALDPYPAARLALAEAIGATNGHAG